MVYVFLLLGLVCPSLFTENQIKEKEQEVSYPNASAYMAATVEEKPKIAITFDDGPNAECTPKLLDGLQKRGVKATFFLIGQNIEKGNNREIVKRMYEEGHLIGNHTYHHVEITRVSNEKAYEELMMCNELIQSITGQEVEYMRPPFGLWQKELEQKIHVLPVMWNVDPLDWATENVDEIVNKVVTRTEENDIILLHDCYDSSVKAALRIIDLLQAEGFEFVTVDQIILD
ncbi:Peptidoglycan/xylan/chitin deacetylase, PgdA/CDA1 family [Faecalicatena contorta]|uniref:Peptidoglycan/xylan/chitin deacetylase, PgdA/CDA1 family n=2 Tax=Faecalicatena contorta TaxID=39482 RepID=A0A315ZZ16_9FIRM|nr:peptidoglycan/xylan/chitin deacetylase (PgdA/CDA1 family) [Faecalicatena contorta]SUQ13484.1 Peptidoglycan/xylan/chitin deacetylase, PgdA/CDA1 family [Faecalicatena contorta]